MIRKILFYSAIILLSSGLASAGTLSRFVCKKCGFASQEIAEGVGRAGIENVTVYCPSCKDFHSVPNKIALETPQNKNAMTVKPAGKKWYCWKRRPVYPCPSCGGKAFAYEGPCCPHCSHRKLQKERLGFWD